MISTDLSREMAARLLIIYQNSEDIILQRLANRVKKGITEKSWTELKAKEIQDIKKEVANNLKKVTKMTSEQLEKAIIQAYSNGQESAEIDFNLEKKKVKVPKSLKRLILETNNVVVNAQFTILRKTIDIYRSIQAEVASTLLTGVETRKQIAKKMLNNLANNGITGFIDKSGRNWSMDAYVEMTTRTVTAQATLQGHADRQKEAGRDLIIISDHAGECPLCRPWENKILSLTGKTPGYKTLEQAKNAGLFHPNCRHTLTGYIPGLTKVEPTKTSGVAEQYDYTQKQRYNERQIRKWKRRELTSIDEEEANYTRQKIAEYQKKQRELLAEYEEKFNMKLFRRREAERI